MIAQWEKNEDMTEISKEECIDSYKQKIENWFLSELYIWGVGSSPEA